MRLPIASPLVSRDGAANKDARLTNMFKESDGGRELAVTRPGLTLVATGSGAGGGLVAFNGELISVYGTTLGFSTSPPTAIWALSSEDLGSPPVSITYANNLFYVYCEDGKVYLTQDGDTWTTSTTGALPFEVSGSVIASNGTDVCFFNGGDGTAYVSHNNTATWTAYAGMTWASNGLVSASVFYDGTYFVACFIDGDGNATMGRSVDGQVWAQTGDRPAWQTNLVSQFCTDGSVVVACNAGNGAAYSDNHGLTWNDSILQPSEDPYLCAFGNGKFVAIAEYLGADVNVYSSPDGIHCFAGDEGGGTWTYASTLPATASGGTLSFNGKWFIYTNYTGNFFISQDAVTWTAYADASGLIWNFVASGNGLSVAAQSGLLGTGFLDMPVENIPAIDTIAAGIYDFAQSPL